MFGICYYPEHWSRGVWEDDARRMAELGLTWVRIGEFAWKRLEPVSGDLQFDWLDDAIDVLKDAGLKVVLGTPTATQPGALNGIPAIQLRSGRRIQRSASRNHPRAFRGTNQSQLHGQDHGLRSL